MHWSLQERPSAAESHPVVCGGGEPPLENVTLSLPPLGRPYPGNRRLALAALVS